MYKTLHSRRYRILLQVLIEIRQRQGITQAELAKRLRQQQSWVSKCERGVRRLDVVELELWCEALSVSMNEFFKKYAAANK